MKKYNNKLLAIGFSIIGLVILAIIGLSYAFFTANVIGNENANQTVITTADLRLVFNDTDILSLDNALPGVSASKTFTVTNIGNVRQRYDINITNVVNEFINDELVYTITSDNEDGGEVLDAVMPAEESTLLTSYIDPEVTITYEITVKFKETGENQDENQGAVFTGKLQIVPRIMGVALGGYVYGDDDNILPNVTVELNSDPIIVQTDEEGYYEIEDAPIGNHTLYIKQGETVLGSKEITLISSEVSQIKNNQTIYLPDKINTYLNIKVENELRIYIEDKFQSFFHNFGGSLYDSFTNIVDTPAGFIAIGQSSSKDGDLIGLNDVTQSGIIVKYKKNGEMSWVKAHSTVSIDQFSGVSYVSDGYVAIGTGIAQNGSYDAIIVKYDLNGNVLWNKSFGGTKGDYFYGITSISDGFIVVGGSASSDGDMSNLYKKGNRDAIIIKYDMNGNIIWKKNYGGEDDDWFFKAIQVEDGYIVVGGSTSKTLDLAGLNKGAQDGIIVKYDLNGNVLWKKNYGGTASDSFSGLISVEDGYILVGNSFSTDIDSAGLNKGAQDGIIVKYDLNGNVLWNKNYGGTLADSFSNLILDKGGYIVIGVSTSTDKDLSDLNKGAQDGIIVKYDLNGNVLWKKNYGGLLDDYITGIIKNLNGYVIVGLSSSIDNVFSSNKGSYDGIICATLNFE